MGEQRTPTSQKLVEGQHRKQLQRGHVWTLMEMGVPKMVRCLDQSPETGVTRGSHQGTNRVCVTLSKGRRSKRWKRRCKRKLSVTWAKLANRTDTSGSRCQNISSLGSGRWAKQTGDNNHPVFNFNSTHRIQSGYKISYDRLCSAYKLYFECVM